MFSANVALSKEVLSPKAIGDLNISLQFGQTTNVSAIIFNSFN